MGHKNKYGILMWIPLRKRLFGSSSRRWEDTIKIDFKEIDCGCGR
jgi:hypothetical protein